ncbi:hypothetical protein BD410DRAFT_846410 [Rickenella mellea]|uniref:Uncharacterized protein n=1 Tax=Rickenella mellea TaxID=50990 RepID=A0A4Y7PFC6_9AGAM|nr:hypothetical protein BD410DRAFT_846410 [Rickenella mellea]
MLLKTYYATKYLRRHAPHPRGFHPCHTETTEITTTATSKHFGRHYKYCWAHRKSHHYTPLLSPQVRDKLKKGMNAFVKTRLREKNQKPCDPAPEKKGRKVISDKSAAPAFAEDDGTRTKKDLDIIKGGKASRYLKLIVFHSDDPRNEPFEIATSIPAQTNSPKLNFSAIEKPAKLRGEDTHMWRQNGWSKSAGRWERPYVLYVVDDTDMVFYKLPGVTGDVKGFVEGKRQAALSVKAKLVQKRKNDPPGPHQTVIDLTSEVIDLTSDEESMAGPSNLGRQPYHIYPSPPLSSPPRKRRKVDADAIHLD